MDKTLPDSTDVLVIGYGPVGAAIGCLLGRYGVRTLIVDRATDIYMAPRAIALEHEALRILHQLVGLDDQAFGKLVIPQILMHSPYVGLFGKIDTAVIVDGHPKLVTFYQPELERALRDKAEACPPVSTALGQELVSLTQDAKSVRATLRNAAGETRTVVARYAIGADGANSTVRNAIGQEFRGTTYGDEWLIVDALGVPDNIDHVEFICNPQRPAPHMPAPGGRTRWEFKLAPGESREEMEKDESIRRLLAPWVDAREVRIERKAVYRFAERSCERYSVGCIFLAGDAAHVTPPFAGQGLVSGLRDAANLCWKLAWVIQGRAAPAILDSYDVERRPHAIAMIQLAKDMGAMIMPSSVPKAILIQGFMKGLRLIPPVRRFLEEFGPKPKNEFKEGLFVAGKSPLRRGGMIPQFMVGQRYSDDLLGSGLALVGFGFDPGERMTPQACKAWTDAGGLTAALPAGDPCLPKLPAGWCAVFRPDRTLLHDGPAAELERIVRESLGLLGATA